MGLRKGIKSSLTDLKYCRGAVLRIFTQLNRQYHDIFVDHRGTKVIEEDWDNLLILDGCRADTFEDICWFEGIYEERTSCASDSQNFLKRNFEGRELHDIVYLSANPYAAELADNTFHAFFDLYRTAWDEELQTITPGSVIDATVKAQDDFPNKRLIAHFMQPHYPFIGEFGREIDNSSIGRHPGVGDGEMNIWSKLMYGKDGITKQQVKRAYHENLEVVLQSIEPLLKQLDGKTVVTADHGNLLGDAGYPIPTPAFGHPPEFFVAPLINVPWFIIDGERRKITSDEPLESTDSELSDEVQKERLRSLGYLE